MPNMSYCRFENTATDLADCELALEALQNADSEPLSKYELEAAKRLVQSCVRIVSALAEVARSTGFAENQVGYDEDDDDLEMVRKLHEPLLDRINLAAEDEQP